MLRKAAVGRRHERDRAQITHTFSRDCGIWVPLGAPGPDVARTDPRQPAATGPAELLATAVAAASSSAMDAAGEAIAGPTCEPGCGGDAEADDATADDITIIAADTMSVMDVDEASLGAPRGLTGDGQGQRAEDRRDDARDDRQCLPAPSATPTSRRPAQHRPTVDFVTRAVNNIGDTLRRGPRDARERIARLRERVRSRAIGDTLHSDAPSGPMAAVARTQTSAHGHDPPSKRRRLECDDGHAAQSVPRGDCAVPALDALEPIGNAACPKEEETPQDHGGGGPRPLRHRLDPHNDHRHDTAPPARASSVDPPQPRAGHDDRAQVCGSVVRPVHSRGGGRNSRGASSHGVSRSGSCDPPRGISMVDSLGPTSGDSALGELVNRDGPSEQSGIGAAKRRIAFEQPAAAARSRRCPATPRPSNSSAARSAFLRLLAHGTGGEGHCDYAAAASRPRPQLHVDVQGDANAAEDTLSHVAKRPRLAQHLPAIMTASDGDCNLRPYRGGQPASVPPAPCTPTRATAVILRSNGVENSRDAGEADLAMHGTPAAGVIRGLRTPLQPGAHLGTRRRLTGKQPPPPWGEVPCTAASTNSGATTARLAGPPAGGRGVGIRGQPNGPLPGACHHAGPQPPGRCSPRAPW